LAGDLGLDTAAFRECLSSGRYRANLEEDIAEGQRLGVGGTPTFFINGRKLVGAQPFERFKQIIEEELERSGR
jgi:protein-disulfide isomerase